MESRPNIQRAARLVWPLFLGLGLMALLALALVPRAAVEAQVEKPGPAVEQGAYKPIAIDGSNDHSVAAAAAVRPAQAFTEPYIRLAKNPLYYDAASVAVTQVTSLFLDQDEAWTRYQTGELDDITPPDSALDEIKASPVYGPQLHVYPRQCTYYHGFSNDVPPFDDPLVRAAFASAIDRPRLISEALSGDELPALTFTPPGSFGHVDGYAAGIGRPYSPTLAAQLLTDSGYTGVPTITLMYNTSDRHQAIAEAVRQMWIDTLGITVTLQDMDWNSYLDLIREGSANERPGIFRLTWCADYPDAHNWHNDALLANNWPRYDNPAYDAVVEAAAAETDSAARLSLYEQAEAYLVMTDTAIAPLYYYVNHNLTRPDLARTYRSLGGQHLDEWELTGALRPLEIVWGSPSHLDPALSGDMNYIEQLFLGLTDFDSETGEVVPELATSWQVSPDGRVYTFTLRSDAYWTDGNPVTAYDAEYGVLRSLDPATGSGWGEVLLGVIENVEALDATHVRFTLTGPASYFLPMITSIGAARPQPQWAIETYGDAWTDPENIVTNGPYKLVAWQSAPHLRIDKRSDDGSPGEGGNFGFRIEYWNDGNVPAKDTVITDTLLGGMTYLTDTSGFAHTGSGSGPIVWDLGTLPAHSWGEFEVLVQITAVASETVTNTIQIATANPYDQGNPSEKERTWSGHVEANDTHLKVSKNAWTWHPAPGYDFVWKIDVRNDGSTASSEVILTETLPVSTTLVEWWQDERHGSAWTEVLRTGDQLVLSNPSIPAWEWNPVHLRLHLDEAASSGIEITNTVTITAANDMEDNDNTDIRNAWPSDPYYDVSVEKGWPLGPLVPGGELTYEFYYRNDGNVPVNNAVITLTLPAELTYDHIWACPMSWCNPPVTPTLVTENYVVWNLDTVDNGSGVDPFPVLRVDDDVPPGTVLTATVEINPQPGDDPYDNTITWVETVNSDGPNLEASIWYYRWQEESQINYQIQLLNRGTEPLNNVWLTATYPISTTWNGGLDSCRGPGPQFNVAHDAPNRQLVFNMEDSDGNWDWGCVEFRVDLDGGIVGAQGLLFTATLEAPYPGDIDPTNNYDQVTAFTGPDVFVEKWLSDGGPWPGEIVTFTVRFGNRNQWLWDPDFGYNSHMTDTLPLEMEFITATNWSPDWLYTENIIDHTIVWEGSPMRSDRAWYFDVVAQVTDTASYGDAFINTIEAYGDSPNDIEPYWDNNVFVLPIAIPSPHFEVDKAYESSRVAGTVVTYTLTADYISDFAATDVVLSDTLPAGLTYGGGDGSFDGTDVTWTFASTSPGDKVAAWFRATLPCPAGTLVNDAYRVVTSTQGVTSTFGPPVIFDVLAPIIAVDFGYAPKNILISDMVHFTATAGTNGTPLTYEWNFGDGITATGLTPTHVYVAVGDYTVVFTAADTCGYTAVQALPVTVYRPADLSLAKTDDPDPVPMGTGLTYILTVTNHGPFTATGVILTDTLPAGVTYDSDSAGCSHAGGVVTCNLGALNANDVATVMILATPNVTGTLVNYAIVATAEYDPDPSNDADSIDTTVTAAPDPHVTGVTPDSGANDQATPIIVDGAYFQSGATAFLDGVELQPVTFVNANRLQATVPAGLTPGTYDLTVTNPDDASGIRIDAFTVLEALQPPTISNIIPAQGPTDTPITIDIHGLNFAPGLTATLSLGATQVPLEGLIFVDNTHTRAVVPINITPGLYDLTVTNPDALSDMLSDAYEAIDPALNDDLYATSLDFWLDPSGPRQGEGSPRMGLMVRRQGGQQPLIASVEVDFYDGNPHTDGTLIDRGIVAALKPDGHASTVAVSWPDPAAGTYVLYAVIDADSVIDEDDETNNVVTRTVTVQPPLPDTTPPTVDSFTINDGAANTTDRQVHLDTTAHDDPSGSGVTHLLFIEYEFIQSVSDWVPVAIGDWLPFDTANTNYLWALQPSPGVHYLQVWVADGDGNISLDPGSQFINYLLPSHVAQGQVHIYRQYLTAGQSLHVRLTSVTGDADLYVWAPDSSLVAYSWTAEPEEGVEFTAETDGVYQIEVEGYTSADYLLEIVPGAGQQMRGSIRPAARGRWQPFVAPGDTPTDEEDVIGVPSPPLSKRRIYLPIILRQG